MLVAYRYPGVSGTSTATSSMPPIVGFQPSGLSNGNLLAVALYDYDYTNKMWVPQTHS